MSQFLISLLLLSSYSFSFSEHNYTVVNVAVKKGSNENIIEATTAIRSAIKIGQPLVAKHFKDFNISDVRITPLGMNLQLDFFIFKSFFHEKYKHIF